MVILKIYFLPIKHSNQPIQQKAIAQCHSLFGSHHCKEARHVAALSLSHRLRPPRRHDHQPQPAIRVSAPKSFAPSPEAPASPVLPVGVLAGVVSAPPTESAVCAVHTCSASKLESPCPNRPLRPTTVTSTVKAIANQLRSCQYPSV
jgi:hypothetical protein